MLGVAMQTLHDTPGLGRDAIRAALKPDASKPDIPGQLQLAGLAEQIEQLRIVALNLTDDELSRIWAALQTPARPSAAYVVSVFAHANATQHAHTVAGAAAQSVRGAAKRAAY